MMLDISDAEAVRLFVDMTDAQRCLDIYAHLLAQQRPVRAWAVLPLGEKPVVTLAYLSKVPPETHAPTAEYADNISALAERLRLAQDAWKHHNARTYSTHVH